MLRSEFFLLSVVCPDCIKVKWDWVSCILVMSKSSEVSFSSCEKFLFVWRAHYFLEKISWCWNDWPNRNVFLSWDWISLFVFCWYWYCYDACLKIVWDKRVLWLTWLILVTKVIISDLRHFKIRVYQWNRD